MSLNPVQFGKDVIDQFGRYLMTSFPVADDRLAAQMREKLRHTVGSESLLYKGPYVHLNQPFKMGPLLDDLIKSGQVHRALKGVFPYPGLHWHQGAALDAIQHGEHVILSTGTGSGKTESFMLPIIDDCLRLRDENAMAGVVALLIYPMNALVNDQLDRLRISLAGTGITFGRYTGETPRQYDPNLHQFASRTGYTSEQLAAYKNGNVTFGDANLPLPHEEALDQESIRAVHPRLLLTNYAQLEYLLLRDKDLDLFRDAPLRFIVFDEVHTYTGALGSEVACLVRRLRDVAQKSANDVVMIGTSATVSDRPDEDEEKIDPEKVTRRFAHRLFGVPEADITVIREAYRAPDSIDNPYLPPLHPQMRDLLDEILREARHLQLQTDIEDADIPPRLVELTSHLCDRDPVGENGMEQLGDLLWPNECVDMLRQIFTEPCTWEIALEKWRRLDSTRHVAPDEDLVAEMLAYLTLGALTLVDGDPILRPKLHYFVQGLQGLGIRFVPEMSPEITFDGQEDVLPLLLCRSCGQHYSRLIIDELTASEHSDYGYFPSRIPSRFERPDEESGGRWMYLTDRFHTHNDEDDDDNDDVWQPVYMCAACHTLHEKHEPFCLNPKCGAETPMIVLQGHRGEPKRCYACGGQNMHRTKLISYTRSSEVADVTILAQSMLTMMQEPSLRKVLIFADSRQEAAFQAGWMDRRSKRFRLRHLAYRIVAENDHGMNWSRFADELIARGQSAGVLPKVDFDNEYQRKEVRWFLIEEFASMNQRRSNLEQLGLAGIAYGEFQDLTKPFFTAWADRLDVPPEVIRDCVQIILDTYRRRGQLSDDLLARWWTPRDREVFDGIIRIADFYRPKALVLEKRTKSTNLIGLLASNGRSTAQVIVQKTLNIKETRRDNFLRELWDWLIEHEYLTPVELVQRRGGTDKRIAGLPSDVYHVNVNRIGLYHGNLRYVCTHCHRSQQAPTLSGRCPEYNCGGHLEEQGRDEEHFDVVQYTQHEFVPMNVREHSAQVSQKKRLEAEQQFKSEHGFVNTIVATPTLEMGVDIGKLEMAVMRNVPPTPANYAQRAGRAGRRHRIAAVFSYAGGSQHDRYFFRQPPDMIAGSVRVPAFSMQNEPLIRKHVHSATLTALRALSNLDEKYLLDRLFPTYISSYVTEYRSDGDKRRPHYFNKPPNMLELGNLIEKYQAGIFERLVSTFSQSWTDDDHHAVSEAVLRSYLLEMPQHLQRYITHLFNQVKAFRQELGKLREIEERNEGLTKEETIRRRRLEAARDSYMRPSINNYTLSWLCVDGFFPGYALSRESVQATCISPFIDLSRAAATALRELTPANWIYADGNVYAPMRLNFNKLRAEDTGFSSDMLRETMHYDRTNSRLIDASAMTMEGGEYDEVISYRLTDIEMERVNDIDDTRDSRRRIAFDIHGVLLDQHLGGEQGRVGQKLYRHLNRETVRLVNLGPLSPGSTGIQGFPLCPVCGEMRSPQSTDEEIRRFQDDHYRTCETEEVRFRALHVELSSDVLTIGSFETETEAINAYEGLLVGARLVIDMGQNELEGFFITDNGEASWAVIYDPLPGGTGFLKQMTEYWQIICNNGASALRACSCESACYQCLQHFRNQRFHDNLDRNLAASLLDIMSSDCVKLHDIPPREQKSRDETLESSTESPAEQKFLERLEARSYPLPEDSQYRVDLGNGNYTIADFAWTDKKILVFIDGTSLQLHGNPAQSRRDRMKRNQAKVMGWQVVEITAQELNDEVSLGLKLEDISFFLGLSN